MTSTTRDRVYLVLTGFGILAGLTVLAGITQVFGAHDDGRIAWRIAMATILALIILQPVFDRIRGALAARRLRRATPVVTTTPTPSRGLRRLDAYLLTAAIVAALVWLAASQRYTVTSSR